MLSVNSKLSAIHSHIQFGTLKSEVHMFLRKFIEKGYESISITYPKLDSIRLTIRTGDVEYLKKDNSLKLNQIESLVAMRFGINFDNVDAIIEEIEKVELSATFQSEVLASKIEAGFKANRAAQAVIKSIMRAGARGVEVTIGGKTKGARAKKLYFRSGWMLKSGDPKNNFVTQDTRHVLLKQGIIGVKVSILCPGPKDATDLPDRVSFYEDIEKKKALYEKRAERFKKENNEVINNSEKNIEKTETEKVEA